MRYTLHIRPSARKELDRLPARMRDRVSDAIDALADNPRPHGCKKLKPFDNYRIRVGDYRIIYDIHDGIVTVEVTRVANRREAY